MQAGSSHKKRLSEGWRNGAGHGEIRYVTANPPRHEWLTPFSPRHSNARPPQAHHALLFSRSSLTFLGAGTAAVVPLPALTQSVPSDRSERDGHDFALRRWLAHVQPAFQVDLSVQTCVSLRGFDVGVDSLSALMVGPRRADLGERDS
jgi:hypothetical protein